MLLSVFDYGSNELFVDIYHIELGGYHEFLVMCERTGPKYLVGSWAEKSTMEIKKIPDIEAFDKYLLLLKNITLDERKEMLRSLFGYASAKDTDTMHGIVEIIKIGMKLYYDPIKVLTYPMNPIINKSTIRNISILGLLQT